MLIIIGKAMKEIQEHPYWDCESSSKDCSDGDLMGEVIKSYHFV